jgi:hypothetical protein
MKNAQFMPIGGIGPAKGFCHGTVEVFDEGIELGYQIVDGG